MVRLQDDGVCTHRIRVLLAIDPGDGQAQSLRFSSIDLWDGAETGISRSRDPPGPPVAINSQISTPKPALAPGLGGNTGPLPGAASPDYER
mgnify:CR=1 FL=1